jgi:hypothetical protein
MSKYRVAKYTNGLNESWWVIEKYKKILWWAEWSEINWRDTELSHLPVKKGSDEDYSRNRFLTKSNACTALEKMLDSIDKWKKRGIITVQVDNCTQLNKEIND